MIHSRPRLTCTEAVSCAAFSPGLGLLIPGLAGYCVCVWGGSLSLGVGETSDLTERKLSFPEGPGLVMSGCVISSASVSPSAQQPL